MRRVKRFGRQIIAGSDESKRQPVFCRTAFNVTREVCFRRTREKGSIDNEEERLNNNGMMIPRGQTGAAAVMRVSVPPVILHQAFHPLLLLLSFVEKARNTVCVLFSWIS